MIKYYVVFFCGIALVLLTGCANVEKETKTFSTIIEHTVHEGEFLGEVPVYIIDFIGDTYEYKSFHPVYKQADGTYTIDYLGKECILNKLNNPIVLPGCEYSKVNWKFDYNCYIEKIPY